MGVPAVSVGLSPARIQGPAAGSPDPRDVFRQRWQDMRMAAVCKRRILPRANGAMWLIGLLLVELQSRRMRFGIVRSRGIRPRSRLRLPVQLHEFSGR